MSFFEDYLLNSPEYSFPELSQKIFSQILNQIIVQMSEKKVKVFKVTAENIRIGKNHEQIEFYIEGLELYKNNTLKVSEYVKMQSICELILSYYLPDRASAVLNESSYLEMRPEAITEFKDLIKVAYNRKTFLNFEFFCDTIRKINKRFSENNFFEIIEHDLDDQNGQKIRISHKLVSCNHCGNTNLFPVFHLSRCGCNLHKNCLENSLIEYGIDPALYEERLLIPCDLFNQHFTPEDLQVIHENQHHGFEINPQVKKFIRYYFLNPVTSSPSPCSCLEGNKCMKVNKDTKKPFKNCAKSCSFCGSKHNPASCKEFLLSIS